MELGKNFTTLCYPPYNNGRGFQSIGLIYNPADQVLTRTNSNNAYTYAPPAPTFLYGINGLNQIADIGGADL